MDVKNILKDQLKRYLIDNQLDRNTPNCYKRVGEKFGVSSECVRSIYRRLRQAGLVENYKILPNSVEVKYPDQREEETPYSFSQIGDKAVITKITNREIKTLDDLIDDCGIDEHEWEIISWKCKRYEAWIKNADGVIESEPKYSIGVQMKQRKADNDLRLQKELLINELRAEITPIKHDVVSKSTTAVHHLYEISIPDAHFGKMSWREESGEDYDIKEATKRYNTAVQELINMVDVNKIDRILFPIGNDMINIDSRKNETFAGTRQDSDSRFFKIVRVVKELLIRNINELTKIAPVDVVVVSGNHDPETMFMLGEILDAYYHQDERVTIDNSAKQRKYYQYGTNGFQYTHGNEEKHQDLGLIFATEQPKLWAATQHRFAKLGHYHKSKKTNYVSVDEFQGFQVQILPSLSGSDSWHASKGYMSKKAAKGFLYHKEKGPVAEFTHTI